MRKYWTAGRLAVDWRTIEWWGAGISLFLQTGAVFPLLASDPDGSLSDPAKVRLRLLALPAYAVAGLILSRNLPQFLIALRRNLPFQLLLVMPFVSVLWSVNPSTTLRRAIGLLFGLLLAYVLAMRFTPRQLLLLVMATLGTCIVLSLALLAVSPGLARMPMDGALRGIFLHKNNLGWIAGMSVLVSAMVLMDGALGFRRTALVLLVASLACLAGAGSMTSTLATVAAFALVWFYSTLARARGIGRVVFVLIFTEMVAILLVVLHEFLVPALEALGKDATLTGRVPLWDLVDDEIARHLLLGFGYQAFWTPANPEAWTIWSKIDWMAPHAHNGFLDTMLSFGLGGTILFMLVILRAIRSGARLQCHAPQDGWLWLNVFMGMVLVMNLTESIFLVPNDIIFVLFSTAIIMFSLHAPAHSSNPGRSTRLRAPLPTPQAP